MNIIKNRYWYFLISLVVIIPGLFFMGLHWAQNPQEGPLLLGIDFQGDDIWVATAKGLSHGIRQR